MHAFKPRIVEPYIKHIPHPTQQLFLCQNAEEVMYGGAAGGGKALCLDTVLPTPTGWTTMRDVQVGDYLIDETGEPTLVLAKSEVMYGHDCYWVEFSDGSYIVADAGHLWITRKPSGAFQKITTEQIAATVTTSAGRRNHAIPTCAPLVGEEQDFLVDPYVLGLWIGDGDTRRGYVTIGQDDIELVSHLKQCGEELTQLSDTHYRVEGLSDRLRKIGVLGTYRNPNPKRVPQMYLRASVRQRRALLQGIVDSDGYVDGDIEVCWTSRGLTDDLLELLHSLGIKATAHESRATLYGKDCGPRWRVKWNTDIASARLERKLARQKRKGFRGTHDYRYIVAVTPVPSVPVQCVKVDSLSSLYLAGPAMIPTHNSDALLMSALQYADVPGYSALLLRRTWPDLSLPGAIMDRARDWLQDTDAQPKEGGRIWVFPSGARLTFGYLQYDKDKYRYQSAEFQFIGFDELTQFNQSTYEYMFSRIRRPNLVCLRCKRSVRFYHGAWTHTVKKGACDTPFPDPKVLNQYGPAKDGTTIFDVPLRMRSATNPGGIGHVWVRDHFIDPNLKGKNAIFIPASLDDNPSLDRETYRKNLEHLNTIDRERLMNGDWDVLEEGAYFQRHWFKFLRETPRNARWCRYWDLAATKDGDWTAGALVGITPEGTWVIADVRRMRGTPREVENFVYQTAQEDGRGVQIRMEQEPGSSGVMSIDYYRRQVLVGFDFRPDKKVGSKEIRANPLSSAVEAGNVYMVTGKWNREFLDEICLFPNGAHDDQVDAVTGAFYSIASRKARILV